MKGELFSEYSLKFLEMASEEGHCGVPDHYDAMGTHTGQCGDTVRFYLTIQDGRIADIRFILEGCMHTLASANSVVFLAAEKTVAQAWEINEEHVIEALEGIPDDHRHCAELAVGALYKALANLEGEKGKG